MTLTSKLHKSGGSVALTIPRKVLALLDWSIGDTLEFRKQASSLILKKVTAKMKMLIISRPNESEELIPWDEEAIKRFKLEDHELSMLNRGKLLWRDEVAFEIEELGK